MGPEVIDLVRLIPNGASVIAVIVVVILFLKQQDKMNDVLKQVTDKFNEQTAAGQKAFQEQINVLSNQHFENQKLFQGQIQSLIDSHLRVSQQTVTALKSLENAVRIVQQKINALPSPEEKVQ